MNYLDWTIMIVYLAGMIGMSWWLGRKQTDAGSYYLGGNNLSWWSIGISTMATQCSTNSLLGAPAFIITTGLLWLQYEFAVPVAMVLIMIFLLPFYRKLNLISIYEYLERRFDVTTRTILSVLFQVLRAFATGVTVYGISLVLQEIVGIPFMVAVLLLGVVTIIYDMLGGMEAVVISDVIQMAVLYLGILLCVIYSVDAVGGLARVFELFPQTGEVLARETGQTFDFAAFQAVTFEGHGLGDGKTFAFLPMLVGGLFLYVSYYGCDQTQVQRELSSKDLDDTNLSLMLNGLMRFPLVCTYCFMGVCIGAYMVAHPQFIQELQSGGEYEFNLAVPVFVLKHLPHGVIGLVIVALFSAAMSSLDSTINSLSATSSMDIYQRLYVRGRWSTSAASELKISRIFTVFWGVVCTAFAFVVGGISNSVIESINKISSLASGPILALFLLGILTSRANGKGATAGLLGGFLFNCYLWAYQPGVSWLWWNVIGFVVAYIVGYIVSLAFPPENKDLKALTYSGTSLSDLNYRLNWPRNWTVLSLYTFVMIGVCLWFGTLNNV
jgi:SSS family transporter